MLGGSRRRGELFDEQVVVYLKEHGKRSLPFEKGGHVLKRIVEATKTLQNKSCFMNNFAKICEGIHHTFNCGNNQRWRRSLGQGIEMESTSFVISEELLLDADLSEVHRCATFAGSPSVQRRLCCRCMCQLRSPWAVTKGH